MYLPLVWSNSFLFPSSHNGHSVTPTAHCHHQLPFISLLSFFFLTPPPVPSFARSLARSLLQFHASAMSPLTYVSFNLIWVSSPPSSLPHLHSPLYLFLQLCSITPPPFVKRFSLHHVSFSLIATRENLVFLFRCYRRVTSIFSLPGFFSFPSLSFSPSFLSNMPAPRAQHLATHIPQFISYVVLNIHPPWKRAQERILKRKHGDFAAIFIREKGSEFGVFSSQSAAFIVLSHTSARRCPR